MKIFLAAALAPLFLASHALGALIIWDTPTDVVTTDPSQVSNVGTFFAAYTPSGYAPLTINGVTFTNSSPNITLAPAGGAGHGGTGTGDYNNLLTVGNYISNGTSSTTPSVISGLTDGKTYQIQIWTPFWDVNYMTRFSSSAPDGATNSTAPNQSALLNLGVGGIPPQFITGTFTASGTTQDFYTFGSNTYGILAAIQIREVPEPTTVALLALGGLALVVRDKMRQRKLAA